MFEPVCMIQGKSIENAKQDFRDAVRVEQYRVGREAIYLPQGLRWMYIPYSQITRAEQSRRVISAGHCVTVREEKPAVDLIIGEETLTLNLEKADNAQTVLDAIRGR